MCFTCAECSSSPIVNGVSMSTNYISSMNVVAHDFGTATYQNGENSNMRNIVNKVTTYDKPIQNVNYKANQTFHLNQNNMVS